MIRSGLGLRKSNSQGRLLVGGATLPAVEAASQAVNDRKVRTCLELGVQWTHQLTFHVSPVCGARFPLKP